MSKFEEIYKKETNKNPKYKGKNTKDYNEWLKKRLKFPKVSQKKIIVTPKKSEDFHERKKVIIHLYNNSEKIIDTNLYNLSKLERDKQYNERLLNIYTDKLKKSKRKWKYVIDEKGSIIYNQNGKPKKTYIETEERKEIKNQINNVKTELDFINSKINKTELNIKDRLNQLRKLEKDVGKEEYIDILNQFNSLENQLKFNQQMGIKFGRKQDILDQEKIFLDIDKNRLSEDYESLNPKIKEKIELRKKLDTSIKQINKKIEDTKKINKSRTL